MDELTTMLESITILEGLNQKTRQTIAPLFVKGAFSASEIVISHGEEGSYVYFIVSGSVRATMYTLSGREISCQDLTKGDMFGELSAIDGLPRSTHVVALEDTELLVISDVNFKKLIADIPQIATATLFKMSQVIRFLCDRVYEFGPFDVSRRIRAEIIRQAEKKRIDDSESVTLTEFATHEALASRLSTHSDAVAREINKLEKSGHLKSDENGLTIVDITRLKAMVWG